MTVERCYTSSDNQPKTDSRCQDKGHLQIQNPKPQPFKEGNPKCRKVWMGPKCYVSDLEKATNPNKNQKHLVSDFT
jgi:hypothetical protein